MIVNASSGKMGLPDPGTELFKPAPWLVQERFRCESARLQQWEQTMIPATLQPFASMIEAEAVRFSR